MKLSLTAAMLLLLDVPTNTQEAMADAPAPLPSAVHCAALFSLTHDTLSRKSGDPAMTAGFAEDAAALRRIVIAAEAPASDAEARADAAIAAAKKALIAEQAARAARGDETPQDLNPCYRVKALGPRVE
ncbi:hypothetical protein [Sphingomonas sp. LaA6.9]|uniref:hypothetical protein n=1 Tax=Sphingomonas sp. LaA6.9 TaxID=2919914 RepID=UPI001F4F8575|nr:hypothetical protein [Sphingomonas sp. LaA6.9]MCJ8159458.1 hypothetical protein [Sphingomonas sp. LaA6.9]